MFLSRRARRRSQRPAQRSARYARASLPLRWLVRFVAGLSVLVAAFSVTVWRQARGVEMEAQVRAAEHRRSLAEEERVALARRAQALSSRGRITRLATETLGLRIPLDREIVFIVVPGGAVEEYD
jgi:plasmid stability protein